MFRIFLTLNVIGSLSIILEHLKLNNLWLIQNDRFCYFEGPGKDYEKNTLDVVHPSLQTSIKRPPCHSIQCYWRKTTCLIHFCSWKPDLWTSFWNEKGALTFYRLFHIEFFEVLKQTPWGHYLGLTLTQNVTGLLIRFKLDLTMKF